MKVLPPCIFRGKQTGSKYNCTHPEVEENVVTPSQCLKCLAFTTPTSGGKIPLILQCHLPPGDVLTLTAAVESLHTTYPNRYLTGVDTHHPDLWLNNPHITELKPTEARVLDMRYDQAEGNVHLSNQRSIVFLEGYTIDLGAKLGIPLRLTTNRPHIYLSDEEKGWDNQVKQYVSSGRDIPFWLMNAGIKRDYTAKAWPTESYQEVVDSLRGKVQFVQVGHAKDDHPELRGVINLVGKTSTRELVRLAYHSRGGIGPVTFLQHLCAAVERPYICIAGGREPLPWITSYPKQTTLHTIGALECCRDFACWKSRVEVLNDSDAKDLDLCYKPVYGLSRPVAKCMAMIQPAEVVSVVTRYNTRE